MCLDGILFTLGSLKEASGQKRKGGGVIGSQALPFSVDLAGEYLSVEVGDLEIGYIALGRDLHGASNTDQCESDAEMHGDVIQGSKLTD